MTASPPGINQSLSSPLLGEPGAVRDAFRLASSSGSPPALHGLKSLSKACSGNRGTHTIPNQIITAWDESMCFAQIWRNWLLKGAIGDTYPHQLFNLRIPGRVLIGVVIALPGKLASHHPLRNQQAVLLAGATVTKTAL